MLKLLRIYSQFGKFSTEVRIQQNQQNRVYTAYTLSWMLLAVQIVQFRPNSHFTFEWMKLLTFYVSAAFSTVSKISMRLTLQFIRGKWSVLRYSNKTTFYIYFTGKCWPSLRPAHNERNDFEETEDGREKKDIEKILLHISSLVLFNYT